MKQLLIVFAILFIDIDFTYSQSNITIGTIVSLDYVRTPKLPEYRSSGYENQVSFRYGLKSELSIKKRFRIGLSVEKYSRRECFDCVYFPERDNLPIVPDRPLINKPEYGCQYQTETKITFMEIPISLSYNILRRPELLLYAEIGYSPQFILGRDISRRDLQTSETSKHVENENYLSSLESTRISLGIEKDISSRMVFNAFIAYRLDTFGFKYETIGLGVNVLYKI